MLGNNWDLILSNIFESMEFSNFIERIDKDYENYIIYPNKENIFRALKLTDFNEVKVVILGQDPYHGPNQANGLAFSVENGNKLPPSLKNIFKEIYRDLAIKNLNGDLTSWAKQGVLLLNSILTVKEGSPNSYKNTYWNFLTDKIISEISKKRNIIFLLWGNEARSKKTIIEEGNFILESAHPSPLSYYRGFEGNNHFSKVNEILENLGLEKIDWSTNEN